MKSETCSHLSRTMLSLALATMWTCLAARTFRIAFNVSQTPFDLPWVRTVVPLACFLHSAYTSIIRRAGPLVDAWPTLGRLLARLHVLCFACRLSAALRPSDAPQINEVLMVCLFTRTHMGIEHMPRLVPNYTVRIFYRRFHRFVFPL